MDQERSGKCLDFQQSGLIILCIFLMWSKYWLVFNFSLDRLRIASTCLCLVEIFPHLHEQLKQWFSFSLTSKENSTGSLSVYCVLTPNVTKKIFAEEVNTAFTDSAKKELKGIFEVCDEPPVSVDFRCSDVSSPIDSTLTMVMGDDMVQRVVDLADIVANNWK
ncbi:unnamed protein product [Eruca vesicaria subsp. sativa]|uniref:Glyceraldehyde 3-phosphate dehydrogenase catalytic domain-containing protein n=1 Tax=Eruca vesicaria subsp. sativa TaxID=29727 RepID=A0ABC8KLL1_ERUVS|nr:unnamed protein product [Eruca vesicaria subsp. sativa]